MFASSNHAVGFYPRQRRIGTDEPVRPDSRYGASKAFGEALGALYAYKHGLRVTCLRIGNVTDTPADKRRLSIWLSPQDLVQLIRIGLEHPDIRHEIFFGASDNARTFWDNEPAFRYGYRPQGRAEDHAARSARRRRQAAARSGRRLVSGRPVLQRRVRPRHRVAVSPTRHERRAPRLTGAARRLRHSYALLRCALSDREDRAITPPDASVADYRKLQTRLGLKRNVVVQPTTYGTDNRCTLEAMAALGPSARGIAAVDTSVTDAELERLTKAGIRGVRFHMLPGGALPWDILETMAARVDAFGWHVQLQLDGKEFPEREAPLKKLPGTLVVDHIGKFLQIVPPETRELSRAGAAGGRRTHLCEAVRPL